ncbi:MAG: FG-GAP repeat protein [Thermoplasmata archaeon]|nr:FG-GAP repeat protein [Thermoplasmata archaeon]
MRLSCLMFFVMLIVGGLSVIPAEIDSSSFSGETNLNNVGVGIFGFRAGDRIGSECRILGDVNGDGYDDFMVQTMRNGFDGYHLIFGRSNNTLTNMTLWGNEIRFSGSRSETVNMDSNIARAGDVNGDGYDDFLIGEQAYDGTHKGKTHLIFGMRSGWNKGSTLDDDSNASFLGENSDDWSGYSVSGGGDINGDGYDDLIIGSPGNDEYISESGQVYIIFGKRTGWTTDVSLSNADASYHGTLSGENIGLSLSIVGDINKDGYDDIAIGGPGAKIGDDVPGKIYLIFGRSSGWEMDMLLDSPDASFIGEDHLDYAGSMISGAGDVNGDGFDDMLIGAYGNDDGGDRAGKTYLVFGRPNSWPQEDPLDTKSNASFIGGSVIGLSGLDVTGVGDVNKDGYDDFMIAEYENDTGGENAGQTYFFYGKQIGWSLDAMLSGSDVSFIGEAPHDKCGDGISGDGDINGDGYPDILIGSPGNSQTNGAAGKVYLIYIEWNQNPVFLNTDQILIVEDSPYSVHYSAMDKESSPNDLIWDWNTNSSWLLFNLTSHYLNGTPDNNDVGVCWVNITVSDPVGGSTYTNFTITVENSNDPPEIMALGSYQSYQGAEFFLNCTATDVDPTNDTMNWSLSNCPFLTINETTGRIYGLSTNSDVGNHSVNVTVSDGNGGEDWEVFDLTIQNINDPPILQNITRINATEDMLFSYSPSVIDIDTPPDTLTWQMSNESDWLTINTSSGLISGVPLNEDVGVYEINISIDDGNSGSDRMTFEIEVINVNDPPEILNDDVLNISTEVQYINNYSAMDIDPTNDILDWSFRTNAMWLYFVESNTTLIGTPSKSNAGSYWVNLSLSDGNGGIDFRNFTIIVRGEYADVEIITDNLLIINEDESYSVLYELRGQSEFDTVIWYCETDASWLFMDPNTGELSGIPTNDDVGRYLVNVSVNCVEIGIDWTMFTLSVVNVNDPPEWGVVISDETFNVEDGISIQVDTQDIDISDTITYSITSSPSSGITIGENSGLITWDDPLVGTYNVTISATDGKVTISQSFILTVSETLSQEQDEDETDKSEKQSNLWVAIPIILVLLILIAVLVILLRKHGEQVEE